MPQPNEVVDVWYHLSFLFSCPTPSYQASYFHREAEFNNCSEVWQDFKTCLVAKMKADEFEARALMDTLSYKQRQGDRNPSNVIWERKQEPSWD